MRCARIRECSFLRPPPAVPVSRSRPVPAWRPWPAPPRLIDGLRCLIKRLQRLAGRFHAAARSGDHLALAAGQAHRTFPGVFGRSYRPERCGQCTLSLGADKLYIESPTTKTSATRNPSASGSARASCRRLSRKVLRRRRSYGPAKRVKNRCASYS
jgi:hypothetical protein